MLFGRFNKKNYFCKRKLNEKIAYNMEKGIVKFYNAAKGWGYLTVESDENTDVYFHISNVRNELKVLLEANKAQYEFVVFDTKPSEKRSGQIEAININLDFEKRKVGYIKKKDGDYYFDYFYIKDYDSEDEYFLHHANFKKSNDRFVSFEEEDPVVFTPSSNEKGLLATEVVLVDNRPFILGFAEFQDYNNSVVKLQTNLCEEENWDYIQKPTGGNPILRSYLNQTFKRVYDQGKIVEGTSSRGGNYSYLNTGLVDVFQNEIFAFFIENPKYTESTAWGIKTPKWRFLEFNTDQSEYFKYFNEIPEIATYFEETETKKLIFDTTITIRPNWDHLNQRKKRVASEEINNMKEQEFRDAIEDSITMARKRIKRNYKTAIPHYYNNDIQFLVPLCERKNRGKALAAMVIQKTEQIYEVTTILSLDQAYNNARLLAKPDREWLNP